MNKLVFDKYKKYNNTDREYQYIVSKVLDILNDYNITGGEYRYIDNMLYYKDYIETDIKEYCLHVNDIDRFKSVIKKHLNFDLKIYHGIFYMAIILYDVVLEILHGTYVLNI